MEPDTYFFSPKEALRVAQEQNRSNDPLQYTLQVCYYNGQKIESDLVNLIHLPIENVVDGLALGRFRLPTVVDFTGLELSVGVVNEIKQNFMTSLSQAKIYRDELNKVYIEKLKKRTLDFSQPKRIYLLANTRTRVMQYVSKDIANVLEQQGYDVFLDLLYGVEDTGNAKNIFEFNPHITININHLNNAILNEDIFNFVWFQDYMPVLSSKDPIPIRGRDYIFVYQSMFRKALLEKGVTADKIFDQKVIPVDTNVFYMDENILREDKVVFVGTYYKNANMNFIDENIDLAIKQLIQSGQSLSLTNLETIFTKGLYLLPGLDKFINDVQQMYTRNICVEWLCQSDKKVEIYGYNWDRSDNQKIIERFHGPLSKDKLNQVYNSAKYVLSASGQVINTQRLGEIIHSGAIPIVYDSREITNESQTWDDECLYFKTQEELNYILNNNIEPKKYRSKEMLEHFTYEKFYSTIDGIIQKELDK